jgi:3-dehydroquinate synthase
VDKKAEGGELRFVVIESPGRAGVRAVPDELLRQTLAACCDPGP